MDGLVFIIMGGVVVYVVGYIIFNAGKSKQSNEDWINRLIKHYNSIYLTFIQVERLGPFEIDWCLIMESGSYFKIVFLPGGCASSVRQQNPDFTVAWEGSPGSVTEIESYLKKRIEAKAVPLPLTPAAVSAAVSVVDVNNDTAESQPIAANEQIATAVPHREPVSNQISHIDQRRHIGDFEFRDPDYRQILLWADALGFEPEEVVSILASSRPSNRLCMVGFTVDQGTIKSLVWDFDRLPISTFQWVDGLAIEDLEFRGKSTAPLVLQLRTLKTLKYQDTNLSDLPLTGVPSLAYLECVNNSIVSLDLSNVPKLSRLACGTNNITELDLSRVPLLAWLDCGWNQISDLDLSSVPLLAWLNCGSNQISKLDISALPLLSWLGCYGNKLSELNLSNQPMLEELVCRDNRLMELDLFYSPSIRSLVCDGNEIASLDIRPLENLQAFECDDQVVLKKRPSQPFASGVWIDLVQD